MRITQNSISVSREGNDADALVIFKTIIELEQELKFITWLIE
jgi:hypothetical protein